MANILHYQYHYLPENLCAIDRNLWDKKIAVKALAGKIRRTSRKKRGSENVLWGHWGIKIWQVVGILGHG